MSPINARLAATYTKVGQDSLVGAYGPHEIVSLLFDGVLDRISMSIVAIEQQDTPNKVRHINKAIQILSEGLRTHLDLNNGGDLAKNLDGLYAYCSLRLVEANAQSDINILREVQSLLEPVVDAWKQNREIPIAKSATFNSQAEKAQSTSHSFSAQRGYPTQSAYPQTAYSGA